MLTEKRKEIQKDEDVNGNKYIWKKKWIKDNYNI